MLTVVSAVPLNLGYVAGELHAWSVGTEVGPHTVADDQRCVIAETDYKRLLDCTERHFML